MSVKTATVHDYIFNDLIKAIRKVAPEQASYYQQQNHILLPDGNDYIEITPGCACSYCQVKRGVINDKPY